MAQLAIVKQMSRQETRSSAGNCQAALRQESRSSAGPDHVTEHTLFTWLIHTHHVFDHALIT